MVLEINLKLFRKFLKEDQRHLIRKVYDVIQLSKEDLAKVSCQQQFPLVIARLKGPDKTCVITVVAF